MDLTLEEWEALARILEDPPEAPAWLKAAIAADRKWADELMRPKGNSPPRKEES